MTFPWLLCNVEEKKPSWLSFINLKWKNLTRDEKSLFFPAERTRDYFRNYVLSPCASRERGNYERDLTFHRTMLAKAKLLLSITVLLQVKDILTVYFITSRQTISLLPCTTSLMDVRLMWFAHAKCHCCAKPVYFIFGGNSDFWNSVLNAAAKIKGNWGS